MNKAEEMIACLEGEIAKRDARIVELHNDASYYAARNEELRSELAAIKAQEPVAARVRFRHPQKTMPDWSVWQQTKVKPNAPAWTIDGAGYEVEYQPLYAAPVSEAKAQGVVMPERWNVPRPMWKDARQPYGNPLNHADIEAAEKFNLALDEVARLNAAPVQQVSVPVTGEPSIKCWSCHSVVSLDDRADADGSCPHCCVELDLEEYLRTALAAAPAAPAADAWIPVSERLPDVPDGDEREVIVCVKRAHNGQSYSFSARYLNNFPLHSDSEDEPMIVTGWHDVKEHAEYDGWYSPLIDSSSGDEVTHWMPLPASQRAKGVV